MTFGKGRRNGRRGLCFSAHLGDIFHQKHDKKSMPKIDAQKIVKILKLRENSITKHHQNYMISDVEVYAKNMFSGKGECTETTVFMQ